MGFEGKKHTEESKGKIGKIHLGKIISEESRKKMSLAKKGKFIGENNPMFGKHHSLETRGKMSKAARKYDIDNEWIFDQYINKKISAPVIANMAKCSEKIIYTRLKKLNIKRRISSTYQTHAPVNLIKEQKELINGELLGDGCLTSSKGNLNSSFAYCTKNRKYLEWLINELNILDFSDIKEKRQMRWNLSITFMTYTASNPTLTEIHKKWYRWELKKNGKYGFVKHIPNDLKLTPIVCRSWYIGDGHRPKYGGLIVATDDFDKNEIEKILIKQLKNKGIDCWVTKYNKLYIPADSKQTFLDYIGECPVESYKYKWVGNKNN